MTQKSIDEHEGCPNYGHCRKDETQCCYLLSTQKCYLNTRDSELFL